MAVDKRNILLTNITENMQFKGKGGRGSKRIPSRDYSSHARRISEKYESFISSALTQKQMAAIKMKGTYAEFTSMENYELVTRSLENRQAGIRLLNVQNVNGCMKATVYIPEGKEDFFRKRIAQYANEKNKKTGNPRHADLIGSIEDIELAMLESFWTDKQDSIPTDSAVNCEIWLRYEIKKKETEDWKSIEEAFHNICHELRIHVDEGKRILFPERIVKMITANRDQLKELLSYCEYITEIRRASELTSFFTALRRGEQKEWTQELLSRCSFHDSDVSVCLLDAGMNDQHPLIAPAMLPNGLQAVDPDWGVNDNVHHRWDDGHGTEMAGVIVYGDLQDALETDEQIAIDHKIESVKILPNRGENPRDLYGARTQDAVLIAEVENPEENRVICMAVTAKDEVENPEDAGNPTSWSATLDKLTSGSDEEENPHRLFLVSAGNVDPKLFTTLSYPDLNAIESVQNPGQSWNAVTIGGYTDRVEVASEGLQGFHGLA